ncbi:transglutaminase domain-containing protein [Streptomyces sp. NPDC127117]|uniref:transglutaminase domain-containing protein n=1 Tax=Streptomyces sp. NPDC127117 TaxID=3345368 RepID=UPI00362F225E
MVAQIHQVDDELLKILIERGLPYAKHGGEYWFDRTDMENIGLTLRLPCPRYSGMRWWSRCLETMKTDEVRRYDLKIAAKCPEPGHEGNCEFCMTSQLEAAALPGSTRMTGSGSFVAQVDLNAAEKFFEGAHADLLELLEPLDFHLLPYLTPLTPEFAEETGLADCRVAARILLSEAAARGLTARPASGYFMAAPFPMKHAWIQFEIDGEWVSADPFLLKAFAEWGIVDPKVWPQNRSLHGILWTIEPKTSAESSIVEHGGSVVDASVTIARRRVVA